MVSKGSNPMSQSCKSQTAKASSCGIPKLPTQADRLWVHGLWLWTQPHWGPLEGALRTTLARPRPQAAPASLSPAQLHFPLKPQNIRHRGHLRPRRQRCWALQGYGLPALMPTNVALVLPSVSALCTGGIVESTARTRLRAGGNAPRCQPQPAASSGDGELTTVNAFSVPPGEPPTASQRGAHAERATPAR